MKTQFNLARVKFGTFKNDKQETIFYGAAYALDNRNTAGNGNFDVGIGVQKLGLADENIANKLRTLLLNNTDKWPLPVTATVRLDSKEGEKSTLTIVEVG